MSALRGYDAWLTNAPEALDADEVVGDVDCPECYGLGYTLERDEDNGLGYRAECACVKRAEPEEDE